MAEIVNLRQARKARQRAQGEAAAAANRARFGQSKAEKHKRDTDAARDARQLDGSRREQDEEGG